MSVGDHPQWLKPERACVLEGYLDTVAVCTTWLWLRSIHPGCEDEPKAPPRARGLFRSERARFLLRHYSFNFHPPPRRAYLFQLRDW